MFDRPPGIAERLLRWLVPGRDGDVIAGDLNETYRHVIPDFCHDLHYAARVIHRNPGYAVAATLCLALGIGVNSTVFSLLDGMYLRMLPVPHPDRVVAIDRDGGMSLFW